LIVNNLGGITSLIVNLIKFRGDEALPQELVLLSIAGSSNTAALIPETEDLKIKKFALHPGRNWYSLYGQLARELGHSKGVLISNDVYDLIMLTHYNLPQKVVQIVHDAYNIKLAVQFESVVDTFVCHSLFYYEMLCQLLHHRREDIHHLPYGIPLTHSPLKSRRQGGPLQLFFLGRHDASKGVDDLYEIHRLLQRKNIPVRWLILGKGPHTDKLKQQWQNEPDVRFCTPPTNEEVLQLAGESDVFVFPTKFEGFPVALVETMSMGCVPVASDLPGGIRELIRDGETGFRCKMNDNQAFAEQIEKLHFDRELLDTMSRHAYETIYAGYDAKIQSPKYQELFSRVAASPGTPRHHAVKKKLGSRLDQPWLPDSIVKYLRKVSE
ncbi:MAG TPA: glycosyltransferase family 4 protein, partial [Puia sp.]|nr:glycosyltransferase family 4 protein [Puia sp.]